MSNPTDLRVIKTRQAIRIALISLLSEKELSDITISELSARAQVNRKTFYRHYRSISDGFLRYTENQQHEHIQHRLGAWRDKRADKQQSGIFREAAEAQPGAFQHRARQGYAPARYRNSPARRMHRERRADTARAVGIHGQRRSVAVFGVV